MPSTSPRSLGRALILCLLALVVVPVAWAQAPPEPPEAVGEVDVALSVAPSGTATPPDGTVGQATVTVTVTCTAVVVLTRPVEVALRYTGGGVAYDVAFDPPVVNFTTDPPLCAEGTSNALDSVVSFRLAPTELFRAPVPMQVEASSVHMDEAVTAEWSEQMGFAGEVSASIAARIPVKTNAVNEVSVRVENVANDDVEYSVTLESPFSLADDPEDVTIPATRTALSPVRPGATGLDDAIIDVVPQRDGEAALLLRVTFLDPRDHPAVLHEQLVSATLVSDVDHDAARAPRYSGAPGPAAVLVVVVLVLGLAVSRRAR